MARNIVNLMISIGELDCSGLRLLEFASDSFL